jgi:hypothetical protein
MAGLRRVTLTAVLGLALFGGLFALGGCSSDDSTDLSTVPPVTPTHHMAGATLPRQAAGYSVLGALPVADQTTATYALDADSSALAVVTLWRDDAQARTYLDDSQWYGGARCGVLDELDEVTQAACIAPLADGVLTVVGSAIQTPAELAELAQAILAVLP